MKSSNLIGLTLLWMGCLVGSARAQAVPRTEPPYPPQAADRSITSQGSQDHRQMPRLNQAELQREARELADLAKTLPSDIDHVSQGLLPKDIIDKLKRVEKLSKHLRSELAP
jgi:hypothetical protein